LPPSFPIGSPIAREQEQALLPEGKSRREGRKPMTKTTTTPRADIYERITAKIVEQLEGGTRPWMQPWGACGSPVRPLRHNGVAYRGINTVLLWMEAAERGYASPFWMTYKQAQELGGQVRKGERSALVVYANAIERTEENDKGEETPRRINFMKGYSVFNADQIDGLPENYYVKAVAPEGTEAKARIKHVDAFYSNLGADIREGGNAAFYRLDADYIGMPIFDAFVSAEAQAATLGHELIHYAVSRIMPHGRALRRVNLFRAMRQFGIIEPSGNDEVWWEANLAASGFCRRLQASACANIAANEFLSEPSNRSRLL
jgi:antirestriction protein ArdC